MKFGLGLNPQNNLPEISRLAKIAEDVGFEYLWLCDYPNIDIELYLKEIAKQTTTIKFGHGVTNPIIKEPKTIITEINNINEISNRSVIGLSVGSKSQADELKINWENPITKLSQTINLISENCKGVPIYIEGQSNNIIEKFKRNANGIFITASNPKDFENINLKKDVEICAYSATSIGYDSENTKNASKIVVAFTIAGLPPHKLELHKTPQKIYENIKMSLTKGNIVGAMKLVDDNLLNEYSITGTPYEIIDKINDLKNVGVGQFIVSYPIGSNIDSSLKLFKDVISTF